MMMEKNQGDIYPRRTQPAVVAFEEQKGHEQRKTDSF